MFFWREKQNFCLIQAHTTCSREALEQGMKYVQSQEERPQNNIIP